MSTEKDAAVLQEVQNVVEKRVNSHASHNQKAHGKRSGGGKKRSTSKKGKKRNKPMNRPSGPPKAYGKRGGKKVKGEKPAPPKRRKIKTLGAKSVVQKRLKIQKKRVAQKKRRKLPG